MRQSGAPERRRGRRSRNSALPTTWTTKPGEEAGDRRHVAVDALDQLAGAVLGVERVVERQEVTGEVGPQGVGGPPADVLGHVGLGDHGRDLRQRARPARKVDGDAHERVQVGAPDWARSMNMPASVGVGELQGDRRRRGGRRAAARRRPLRPQVGRDEVAIEVRVARGAPVISTRTDSVRCCPGRPGGRAALHGGRDGSRGGLDGAAAGMFPDLPVVRLLAAPYGDRLRPARDYRHGGPCIGRPVSATMPGVPTGRCR